MPLLGLQVGIFLAGGLLLMLLGLVIFRENPSRRLNRVTAIMLFFGGLGSMLGAMGAILQSAPPEVLASGETISPAAQLESLRQLSVLWEFFFPTLVLFSLVFPRENEGLKKRSRLVWLFYLPYLFHLLLVLLYMNPDLIPHPDLTTGGGILGSFLKLFSFLGLLAGTFFDVLYQVHLQLWAAVNVLYVVLAIAFLHRSRKSQENPRLRTQLAIIQVGIGTSVGIYMLVEVVPVLLPFLTLPIWLTEILLPLALVVGCGAIAWVIIRHQFLDIQVLAKRSLIYSAAVGLVLSVYFLLYSWFLDMWGRLAGPDTGRKIAQVLFVFIAVIAFQPLLGTLEALVERFFIRDEKDYRNILQQSVRNIIGILEMDSLVRAVYQTLERAFLVEEIAVILLDRNTDAFRFVRRGPPPLRQGRWEIGTPKGLEFDDYTPEDSSPAARRMSPSGPGKVVFRMRDPVVELLSRAPGPVRYDRLLTELGAPDEKTAHPFDGVRPSLVVPLKQRNELLGILSLGSKLADTSFNSEELTLLSILASQVTVALENAWLHEERLEQERLREELAVARQIQQGLLPPSFPRGREYEVSAINLPSREIGGDYFDFLAGGGSDEEPERLLMVIGDVSGKGTPAALLMASLQATLRAVHEVQPSLSAMAEKVNNVMCRTTDAEKFVTLFMAEMEISTRTLTYVNAGHNFPILTRAGGEQVLLEEGGLLVGVMEGAAYEEGTVRLAPGDVLVMYTDGVTEAQDRNSEEFGEERLMVLLRDRAYLGAREIRDEVYREVLAFAGEQPQYDDLTLVVLKLL